MFDGGCEIENGIWGGRSRLQSGQYLIFSDNNVIFAFSVCICVFETLIAWTCDCRCEDVVRWSCGSEDCREDNPSKLSFFAKYCVSSQPSHPVSLQFKQEPGQSESDLYYLQEPTGPNDVGNTQSAAWEDLRDVWHGWHVNSPCKILLWCPNEFTPGLHNVTM